MSASKVHLNLVGLNGNIFNLVGAFARQARKECWSDASIARITSQITTCKSYQEAVHILMDHCVNGGVSDEPIILSSEEAMDILNSNLERSDSELTNLRLKVDLLQKRLTQKQIYIDSLEERLRGFGIIMDDSMSL